MPTPQPHHTNLRREPRYARGCDEINWRQNASGALPAPGWISDVSRSGLSFLIEPDRPVRIGQELHVQAAGDIGDADYRVVHVRSLACGLSLVGCARGKAA